VDRTPSGPPRIFTVTLVSCLKPTAGVNFSELVPAPCQVPAILGLIEGIGEPAASGSEKLIVMSVVPLTAVARLAGVTDVTRTGPVGA
jgi:hypothetical protein